MARYAVRNYVYSIFFSLISFIFLNLTVIRLSARYEKVQIGQIYAQCTPCDALSVCIFLCIMYLVHSYSNSSLN
jgi:hypothetical protein